MTDPLMIGAMLLALALLLFFGSFSGESNFQLLLETWKKKRLAEFEVAKAEALHERVCPRLTDTPHRGSR